MKQCSRSAGETLLNHVCQEEDVCVWQVLGEVLHHALGVVEDIRCRLLSRGLESTCSRGQTGGEGDDEKTVDDEEDVVSLVH